MFAEDLVEEVDDLFPPEKSGDSDAIVIKHFRKVLAHVHQSDVVVEGVDFSDKKQYMSNLFFFVFSQFF